ncbi:MAG: hypothetical protein IJP14_02375 [Clostridia bacterium]|nr:hypothetical protein [Clostridia bacterium]
MQHKVLCLLLAIALLIGATACTGDKEDGTMKDSATTTTGTTQSAVTPDDTKYAKFRQGLNNTYAKLTAEKELTIAYIGGSITAGASAQPVKENCYRALTTAWFKKQFPDAKITEINMGIGMAGSKLAAYYVKSEVVPKKPDLVFVECAINDYIERKTVTLEEVEAQYETIIRQLRTADPTCDIVALYTTNADVTAKDEFYEQSATQDAIAAHYGILSINIGRELRMTRGLREGRRNGELTDAWRKVFADDVHPNNDGHQFYADSIAGVLKTALLTNAAAKNPAVTPYTLPAAKSKALLMDVQYITADKIDLSASPNWVYDAETGSIRATKTDSELTFTFTGTDLHFNCTGLPWGDVARASYSVDGGEWVTLQPCMIRAVPIVKGLSQGTHTIRFKSGYSDAGTPFSIAALMVK